MHCAIHQLLPECIAFEQNATKHLVSLKNWIKDHRMKNQFEINHDK